MSLTALTIPVWVTAQTVLTVPQKGKPGKDALANPKKQTAAVAEGFKSAWPLYSLGDKQAFGNYVSAKGARPAAPAFGVKKASAASEDAVVYTYTGFNQAAGHTEDGSETGGLVNFNLKPFACDSVSSDPGLSPYSYMAKGKLYSFMPHMDVATGKYTSLTRTTYDANTLAKIDERTVDTPEGTADRMPYILSYDDSRDVVYAISMGASSNNIQPYYLNVLDTATCKLQRIGKIGEYNGYLPKGSYNPRAFVATGGVLRIQNDDDSLYIEELNPITLERKIVGSTTMPTQYTYGLQPMIYDANKGYLLINHYDFNFGTVYYKVSPYVAYGAKDRVLKTEEVEKTPTGFTFFYQRPETEASYFKYTLADIADLKVDVPDGGTKAAVSFTVPDKDNKGNAIDFPSYAPKNLKCNIYVDNQWVSAEGIPATINYGSKITATVDLTPGLHTVTVQLYPMFNEVEGIRNARNVVVGYDAPDAVGSPTLAIAGDKATITWEAPVKGKFADFGSDFDASDITYKVVRDIDGKVIADGIKETSATDDKLFEEIQTYSYTIYAVSHGNTSFAATTNKVSAGQYLPLPYTNDFSGPSSLDGYTIIDNDTPGTIKTWQWNNFYGRINTNYGQGDDWIITPDFSLTSDKVYALRYDVEGAGNLRTTVGQGKTADAQDNVLDDVRSYKTKSNTDYETKEYYFRPAESGKYNFGLYNYNLQENDHWAVDNLSVKEIAASTAPDKVRSLTFTPDAKGALGGTISFKLPATDIAGNSLTKLSKVVVYDLVSGKEQASLTNVAPGAEASVKVKAVQGFNSYKVVAVNDNGEGWPVVLQKFVGIDVPQTVKNLKLSWGEDRNVINMSWTAPEEGVNGGYVDPSAYTYTIYKYTDKTYPPYSKLAETTGETSVELSLQDIPEKQDQYIIGLTASNAAGESDYVRAGIVLGKPYDLPLAEPFDAKGIEHSPWLVMAGKNQQAWTVDQGYYNDKIQPENDDNLQLILHNTGSADGSSRFISPIIDFTNAKNPVLSVWLHHSEAMPEGAYATVDASIDGSRNYIAVSDTVRLTGNNGWTEHIFDLSKLKGKKAQIALDAYMPDPATRIFADNWTIREASGNDLAIESISQPYMPVVGDTADIAVTVTNRGLQTADNYSVMFTLNGNVVDEKEAAEALAPGKSARFHFTLPVDAATSEFVYSAELVYDDDNKDNNSSSEVELSPRQIALNAPSSLVLTGNDALSWTAPEATDGREVLLDFEDQPAFKLNDIDGWKTVDRDGNLTTTFVQYYGNYWPYANKPLAWMTWSNREAGCPTAAMWQAYEGEKCIITFGNYGADAEGRPSTKPDDDWFISPEVKGGTSFSFMTSTNGATSTLEVLTSSTDDKPESFTHKVTNVSFDAVSTWKKVEATLPEDARYVAIHTTNTDFGIMIDNIAYTEAKAPVLKGYKVYRDNVGESFTVTPAATATANGSYAVSAVYNLGESALSNTVSVTTGIANATAGKASVAGGKGVITIKGVQGEHVNVYNVGGSRAASLTAAATQDVHVAAGVYLVKVGDKTFKVLVK